MNTCLHTRGGVDAPLELKQRRQRLEGPAKLTNLGEIVIIIIVTVSLLVLANQC